ncbi:MAG: oxygenase MpaB family protein [Xanthomonadales bacterium]
MTTSPQPLRDTLRQKMHTGDPPADAVAEAIAEHAPDAPGAAVMAAVMTVLRAPRLDQRELAGLGEEDARIEAAIARFLEATAAVPPGHSAEAVVAGNRLFEDNAVFGFVGLGCASLLECYCWSIEAEVLGLTHGMERNIGRRIPETAMFVLDVMSEPTLGQGDDTDSRGLAAIRKVRLLHALMRWLIVSDPEDAGRVFDGPLKASPFAHMARADWPGAQNGKPISQAFLAGTLLTFSLTILRSMRRLWLPISQTDAEDYLHRWKVIGFKLGVDEDLLPCFDNEALAGELHAAMMAEFRGPTAPGRLMAATLENYMVENIADRVPLHRAFQLQRMPGVVMWQLAGRETCRALDLDPGRFGKTLGWLGWQGLRVIGFLKRVPVLRRLSYTVFEWLGRVMWGWRHEDDPALPASEAIRGAPAARGVVIERRLAEHWGVPVNTE